MITVDNIMLEEPADGVVCDPMAWFDSPGPFELEIGCGKGGFLLSRARANPELRLLGIEWANKYFRYCADRMARWQLTNVRVMRTDAKIFFMHHLPPNSVSALHLYHPDPWPKKRHHKRRMVQADFVGTAIRVIKPGGRWLIQSDHQEYFEFMRTVIGTHPEFVDIPWEEADAAPAQDWEGTNFEIKYAREGRAIYRAAYQLA